MASSAGGISLRRAGRTPARTEQRRHLRGSAGRGPSTAGRNLDGVSVKSWRVPGTHGTLGRRHAHWKRATITRRKSHHRRRCRARRTECRRGPRTRRTRGTSAAHSLEKSAFQHQRIAEIQDQTVQQGVSHTEVHRRSALKHRHAAEDDRKLAELKRKESEADLASAPGH